MSFGSGGLEAVTPVRILDSRDGTGAPAVPVGPSSTVELQVAGRAGLPSVGVGAVVLNVTAVGPSQATYVTVWPTGAPRPLASNLNLTPGETVPNLVVVKVGVGGKVSLYLDAGNVDLIADLAGWFPEGQAIEPLVPARLLDTRDGTGAPQGAVGPTGVVNLDVTGRGGVPSDDVAAVVLNVTAVSPTAPSWVTVWPTGENRPVASNLNLTPGVTIPNLVVAKVGSDGMVSLSNESGSTHLLADVAAWIPSSSAYKPLTPARLLDTRFGVGAPAGPVGPRGVAHLSVLGRGGLPADGVGAVVLNVTAVAPTAASWVTVWPAGVAEPLASNLNLIPGRTTPNLVVVKVGESGVVDLSNHDGQTHLLADLAGWFPSAGENQTVLHVRPGTVLAGAGDVVSVTGSAETGGSLILSRSADVPAVGGHVTVSPHLLAPDGVFGAVTAVTANGDGTATVTFAAATLEAGFSDISSSYVGPANFASPFSSPIATSAREATKSAREAAVECGGVAGPSVTGDVSLDGFTADFKFDLSDRYLRAVLHGAITITLDIDVEAGVTCRIKGPQLKSVWGVALAETAVGIDISLSGALAATVSATAAATLGFIADGLDVQNLTHIDLGGAAEHVAQAQVRLGFRPFVEMDLKAFGLAGVVINVGIEGVGTYIPPTCGRVTVGVDASISFEVGRWGIDWTLSLGTVSFGPWTLYETAGCGDPLWRGAFEFKEVWSSSQYQETFVSTWTDASQDSSDVTWTASRHGRGRFVGPDNGCVTGAVNGYDVDGSGSGTGTYTLTPFVGSDLPSRPEGTYARLHVDTFEPDEGYPLIGTGYSCDGTSDGPRPFGSEGPLNLVGYAAVTGTDSSFGGAQRLTAAYTWTDGDGFYTRTVTINLSKSGVDTDGDGLPDDVDPA